MLVTESGEETGALKAEFSFKIDCERAGKRKETKKVFGLLSFDNTQNFDSLEFVE